MESFHAMFKDEVHKKVMEGDATDPIVIDAKACLPRLKCFICNDLERLVTDRHVMWYGDPFLIKACPRCTGSDREISTATHTEQYYRGRRMCYHGAKNGGRTVMDFISDLASLYRAEYKAADDAAAAAKAAADAKAAAAAAAAREAARIKKEQEEKAIRDAAAKEAAAIAAKKARAEALKPYQSIPDDELYRNASWEDIGNREFNETISERTFAADITKLVAAISEAIQSYTGNLLALPNLLSKLDFKFRQFSTHKDNEDSHIQVKEDKEGRLFFMKFTYTFFLDDVVEHCCFMDFTKTVKKIRSHLVIMRPKEDNLEASEICRRMMNDEAIKMIQGIRSA
jgi:flagellar biosynthesis GTPase FlhF